MRRGQSEQDELYRAYLLRCWQERDGGAHEGRLWRFAVEEIFGERRRHGFGSLEALITFLKREMAGHWNSEEEP